MDKEELIIQIYKKSERDLTLLLKRYNDVLNLYVNMVSKFRNVLEEDDLTIIMIDSLVSSSKDIIQTLVNSQQKRLNMLNI